jgi:hypothetical protein
MRHRFTSLAELLLRGCRCSDPTILPYTKLRLHLRETFHDPATIVQQGLALASDRVVAGELLPAFLCCRSGLCLLSTAHLVVC